MSGSVENNIDWTRVYGALADVRRRDILRYLAHTPGNVPIPDIATHLQRQTDGENRDEQRTRIEGQLYHVHLPKLEDADLIRLDSEQKTVSLTALGVQLPIGMIMPHALTATRTVSPGRAGD